MEFCEMMVWDWFGVIKYLIYVRQQIFNLSK